MKYLSYLLKCEIPTDVVHPKISFGIGMVEV